MKNFFSHFLSIEILRFFFILNYTKRFQIANYPQPLYKKFEKLDEAKAYYKKYSNGEEDGNLKGFVLLTFIFFRLRAIFRSIL